MQAIHETGLEASHDEINSMMGWSKQVVFETLWKKQLTGASSEVIHMHTRKSFTAFRRILEDHYEHSPVLPAPGCQEVFSFLREKGVKIALTTGFYRKVTDILLRRLGWDSGLDQHYAGDGVINASVSSDQVFKGRPSPFMIFRAMELCGVTDVRRIIKIGDTPSDLAEGKNAGCLYSLGITNGTHTEGQLQCCENDGLLADLHAFRTFLVALA
jgi:phosphonatase-like hydrolase